MATGEGEKNVEQFAERLRQGHALIGHAGHFPSADLLDKTMERLLPKQFVSLMTRYAFRAFTWGQISFLGNSGSEDQLGDFPAEAIRDGFLWRTLIDAGLIQFARPADGQYDPICFDVRSFNGKADAPVVRVDHEEALIRGRVKVLNVIAPSFAVLVEMLLASPSGPVVD
jgi:hypothetical protein